MCQARKIVNGASDAAHAMNMAEFDVMIDKVDREWDVDTTVYTFTDGSKLIVNGDGYSWEAPQVNNITYITDDDYARVADKVRDYETDKHTLGDGPDAEPVEVITPKAWFADCADYVLPDTEEGCEELRIDLIDVLEAEEGSALLALAALGMVIRDAFLNNGMTVDHLRKPK